MFRLTSYMQSLIAPALHPEKRRPASGPVVIWNLIRRCNLTCKHCYAISADKDFPGELTTQEAFDVLSQLKEARVPAVVLSGGEPLLRADLFEIAHAAKKMGVYTALSSNGTLINSSNLETIEQVGFDYVGISLDGLRATHDRFRRCIGAFDQSLAAIRLSVAQGLKVGIRFTLTQDNFLDLPAILKLVEDEKVHRFYFSHLNYAGRGNKNRADDAHFQMTRQAMTLLFETCWRWLQNGHSKEVTTGNNDADAIYFLHWVEQHHPSQVEQIRGKLAQWGGNASGVNVANIDNLGNVHPDTMWWHATLGNVRTTPFGEIWHNPAHPLLKGLRNHPRILKGRCGNCQYLPLCNGNSRVRAEQISGHVWQEDPGCYLHDAEIGLSTAGHRLQTTPWSKIPPTSGPIA